MSVQRKRPSPFPKVTAAPRGNTVQRKLELERIADREAIAEMRTFVTITDDGIGIGRWVDDGNGDTIHVIEPFELDEEH